MPDQTGLFINTNKEKYSTKVESFATTPEGYYYPTFNGDAEYYTKCRKDTFSSVVREHEQTILKQVAPIQLSWWL